MIFLVGRAKVPYITCHKIDNCVYKRRWINKYISFLNYPYDSLPTQCLSWISTIAIAVKSCDHKQKKMSTFTSTHFEITNIIVPLY